MNRRHYLKIAGLLLAQHQMSLPKFAFRPRLKTSCNFFSFNEQIKSGSITTQEAIEFCAQTGFDGVDITGYYFSNYPVIPSDEEIYAIKKLVFDLGMEISGTGVRNDFAQPDQAAVASDLEMVKEWTQVAAKLGAPMLRIFAGKKLKKDQSRTKAIEQVVTNVKKCIEVGRKHGVIITYQNHNDVLFTAAEVKEIMEELKDPWFGLNLDIGSLRSGDPYQEIGQLVEYAHTWQIKEHVYRNGVKEELNLEKLAKIIGKSSYRGFLPLETLPPSDPWTRLPKFLESLKESCGLA